MRSLSSWLLALVLVHELVAVALLEVLQALLFGGNFGGGGAYTSGVHSSTSPGCWLWAGSRGVATPAGPFPFLRSRLIISNTVCI
jgi:hypothetical protein